MDEYELAALALRGAGNWIAAAHVAVGLIQAGIVWIGIRAMHRAGDRRAAEQDQRHAEAMAALRALIVRADRSALARVPSGAITSATRESGSQPVAVAVHSFALPTRAIGTAH